MELDDPRPAAGADADGNNYLHIDSILIIYDCYMICLQLHVPSEDDEDGADVVVGAAPQRADAHWQPDLLGMTGSSLIKNRLPLLNRTVLLIMSPMVITSMYFLNIMLMRVLFRR